MVENNENHAAHLDHQGLSPKTCVIVLACLIVLTGVTVGVSELNLGYFHILVAMIVASVKAALVIFWFMHIKYEGIVIRGMVFTAFLILSIFISFTFFDVAYR